jgi:hypothetical protein
MNKIIRNNIIVSLFFLFIYLIIDFVDVRIYRFEGFKYELFIALSVIFLSYVFTNKNLYSSGTLIFRVVIITFTSACLTVLWFIVSVFIVLQFHLLIGGNL